MWIIRILSRLKWLIMHIVNKYKVGIIIYTKGIRILESRFSYQSRFNKFDILPGEKVLDIGGGGDPFPLATHLADRYTDETIHRAGELITDDRPFIVCDVEKMPYKNSCFDFIYCCHVLEHTNNPEKACKELMRVGKRGYIETPTRMSDIIFNFTKIPNFHRWHIVAVGDTLIFVEYSCKEQRDTGSDHIFTLVSSKLNNPIRKMVQKNRDLFVNMFFWERKFDYYIFNKFGKMIANFEEETLPKKVD